MTFYLNQCLKIMYMAHQPIPYRLGYGKGRAINNES
jgi:hypothetical protein